MYDLKVFPTTDSTLSYTSEIVKFQTRGNRTGIFQANVNAGDAAVLQARLSSTFAWVDVITVTDDNAMQEVILAPEFRLVTTNTSGNEVLAAIHV